MQKRSEQLVVVEDADDTAHGARTDADTLDEAERQLSTDLA
jgi:hypothetical protein